jgi:hypothetical protein
MKEHIKLISVKKLNSGDKKYEAKFEITSKSKKSKSGKTIQSSKSKSSKSKDSKSKSSLPKTKTIKFGAKGMSDFTIHKDTERRNRYINRHKKDLRTKNPMRAGYLSMYILWNKKTFKASLADYKRRLNIYNKTGKFPENIPNSPLNNKFGNITKTKINHYLSNFGNDNDKLSLFGAPNNIPEPASFPKELMFNPYIMTYEYQVETDEPILMKKIIRSPGKGPTKLIKKKGIMMKELAEIFEKYNNKFYTEIAKPTYFDLKDDEEADLMDCLIVLLKTIYAKRYIVKLDNVVDNMIYIIKRTKIPKCTENFQQMNRLARFLIENKKAQKLCKNVLVINENRIKELSELKKKILKKNKFGKLLNCNCFGKYKFGNCNCAKFGNKFGNCKFGNCNCCKFGNCNNKFGNSNCAKFGTTKQLALLHKREPFNILSRDLIDKIDQEVQASKIQKQYRKHYKKAIEYLKEAIDYLYENQLVTGLDPSDYNVLRVIEYCYILLREDDLYDPYYKEFLGDLYKVFWETEFEGTMGGQQSENRSKAELYFIKLLKRAGLTDVTIDNYLENQTVQNFLYSNDDEMNTHFGKTQKKKLKKKLQKNSKKKDKVPDNVKNPTLYLKIKRKIQKDVKSKNRRWGAYDSGRLVREYKSKGGKYSGKTGKTGKTSDLSRWYKEKWIDACAWPKVKSCGRTKASIKSKVTYCRPMKRVDKNTPKTIKELTKAQIKSRCKRKSKSPKKIIRN